MDLNLSSPSAEKSSLKSKRIQHKKQKNHLSSRLREKKKSKADVKFSENLSDSDSFPEDFQKVLAQPNSRFADIDDIKEDKSGKAFDVLLSAPVSTSSFIFKSEKTWIESTSLCNDYFSVDVNHLLKTFNCLPFNQYIRVDEEYLNKDEITSMHSLAEQVRKDYVRNPEELNSTDFRDLPASADGENNTTESNVTSERNDDADDSVENLDFLLSLKEPVKTLPVNVSSALSRGTADSRGKTATNSLKSVDLEKWLDSVLDD